MKKINTLVVLLLAITVSVTAQTFQTPTSAPGELDVLPQPSLDTSIQDGQIQTFKEESIGVFFMPIPLNIETITFTTGGAETIFDAPDDLFKTGIGVAVNADFSKSGFGFGAIGYYAIIGGDNLRANDGFFALKYDIPLGDRAETDFEISPLLGVGNMSFQETEEDLYLGSSFYFSGGVRITWRIANRLFLGADLQTVPSFFNTKKLLGVEDEVDDAKIDYKFIAQLNLSLRYSIF